MFHCCCSSAGGQAVSSTLDVVDEKAMVREMGRSTTDPLPDAPQAAWAAGHWHKKDGPPPQVIQSSRLAGALLGAHSPRSAAVERSLVIRRDPGDSPGLDVDLVDGVHALVVAVRPGAFQKWNIAQPDQRVEPNDRIVEVNGKRGDVAELIGELREKVVWNVKLQRPIEFECALDRRSTSSLGMDLRYAPGGTSLAICSIGPGPVQEWNERPSNVNCKFAVYDRIVELNGCRGPAAQLLTASEGQEHLWLKVLKYGS